MPPGRDLRAALAFAIAALALLVAGCGGGGGDGGGTAEAEKASDTEILNVAIGREVAQVEAYDRGLPLLRGRDRALAEEIRAQAQEHVDALTKAIRGLGGEVEAEAEEVDFTGVKSARDFLTLAYELGGVSLNSYLSAVPHLVTPAPSALAAAIAANEAEHLVTLRQALGATLPASVPQAFHTAEEPPPASPPGGKG